MSLVELDASRKLRLSRHIQKIMDVYGRNDFNGVMDSTQWVLEVGYAQPFYYMEFMDSRRERILNLLHTLMLISTLDWAKVWVLQTYKSRKTERLVVANSLSDGELLNQTHFVHRQEQETLTLERLRVFNLYGRRADDGAFQRGTAGTGNLEGRPEILPIDRPHGRGRGQDHPSVPGSRSYSEGLGDCAYMF